VNEKFLWRKLFDHDPRFVVLSDKLACKEWVTERAPELAVAKVHWLGKKSGFHANRFSATGCCAESESWLRHKFIPGSGAAI